MPSLTAPRWKLPGPAASSYWVVRWNDVAAQETHLHVPPSVVIQALDRWLATYKRVLQDMDATLAGGNSAGLLPAREQDLQLRHRLTEAFHQRRLVALETRRGASFPGLMGRQLPGERLESALALEEMRTLVTSMEPEELFSWLQRIFGDDIPSSAFTRLRSAILDGTLPRPEVVLIDGQIEGHSGAYRAKEKTIFINCGLVRRAREFPEAAWELCICLIEEFGHHLDHLLRTHYSQVGGDARMDEGARVAYALLDLRMREGVQRRVFAEYQGSRGRYSLEIEFAGMTAAVQRFLSQEEQEDDAASGGLEFFGAGRGSGKPGSYGHESIEDALAQAGFDVNERRFVYFGNWLRDHSQVVDPKVVRKKGSASTKGISRASLTAIIDVVAREKFGDTPAFRVREGRLGVYRNEEHIDNPQGITDARALDPAFRNACTQQELKVNAMRMKNFIRTGVPTTGRAARAHRVSDGETLDSLARANGMTWQELARYNFGTDDKDAVSRQLYSKVGCRKPTADGRSYMFTRQDTPGVIQIPGQAVASPGVEASYTAFHYLSEQLRAAVKKGRSAEGFLHLGQALHTLEDFFSHTNFVELMLIHLGAWVQPWVPNSGPRAKGAHALTLTSGKFGGLDTAASLLLGIAETLKKEEQCIPGQYKASTKIAIILLKDRGYMEVHDILVSFTKGLHAVEKEYPRAATFICNTIGVVIQSLAAGLGEVIHGVASQIDDGQTAFLSDPASDNPTHSQLAKDHDDHPLHPLAAVLAQGAVKDVGLAVRNAWLGKASGEAAVLAASAYFLHPARVDEKGMAGWMVKAVRKWAASHPEEIKRLGSRSWLEEWTRNAAGHQAELMRRAKQLMGNHAK